MTRRNSVYTSLKEAKGKRQAKFAILLDPDKYQGPDYPSDLLRLEALGVDLVLVGGSLMVRDRFDALIRDLKSVLSIPVVIFPGSVMQISAAADALLLLSLISGRNPEYLIGQQVVAAPYLKASGLETISTGYLLIDGGAPTTASYMSGSTPIPYDKPEIAACTALAGDMLGLSTIYLDAGSGARRPVAPEMIRAVAAAVETPLFVGGGIRRPETITLDLEAGADVIVVGNALEKDPGLLEEMLGAVRDFNYLRTGP